MHALHLMNRLPWPLNGGRAINGHHLMRTLIERGHAVTLVLRDRPEETELASWPLSSSVSVEVLDQRGTGLAGRRQPDGWMRYWGVEPWMPAAVANVCEQVSPDYVEAIGLDTPLWLTGLSREVPRLWLAGDSPSLLHRTLVGRVAGLRGKAGEVRRAAVMWMYERWVSSLMDTAVAVSAADAASLGGRLGFREVLMTPNGIDADHFRPVDADAQPDTAVFWGRLDFPPNADAVTHFVRDIWPTVRAERPSARFYVVGPATGTRLRRACDVEGVSWVGEVSDVRPWVARGAAAVMPLRTGAGIKNKLLEAAAMARPIVASSRAVSGLTPSREPAWRQCDTPRQWAQTLLTLWDDAAAARRLGQAARQWVLAQHDWSSHAIERERWLSNRVCHAGRPAVMPATQWGAQAA